MNESTPRKKSPKPLRERMPGVAAHIDGLRLRFGPDAVDARLRQAKAGEATFYAREGPNEFGTAPSELQPWLASLDEAFNGEFSAIAAETGPDLPTVTLGDSPARSSNFSMRLFCDGCDGSCVGTARRCSEMRQSLAIKSRSSGRKEKELWASPAEVQPIEFVDP